MQQTKTDTLILKLQCIVNNWLTKKKKKKRKKKTVYIKKNLWLPLTYNGGKSKLAFTAISLQIFWQKIYRNVSWVVLYKTYIFCCKLLIWLVTMATKRQNLRQNIKNINSTEAILGKKLKLCRIVFNNSLYKNVFFFFFFFLLFLIAVAQAR